MEPKSHLPLRISDYIPKPGCPLRNLTMSRYAVLTHDYPFFHWDLLIDPGDPALLWTWRITSSPLESTPLSVERLQDHRRIYLNYSGPIGGNRGTVEIWDRGEFDWLTDEVPSDFENSLKIRCKGIRLNGDVALTRTEKSHLWTYQYLPGALRSD